LRRAQSKKAASCDAARTGSVIKLSDASIYRAALMLAVLLMIPTLWFALRTYGSFEL